MKQSQLFTRTTKETPKDEQSLNAQLLIRAGFVDKLMAGVYTYLPLGLRVLNKINNVIREEINSLGAQEILMPALSPKENWDKTGRWTGLDVLFKLKGAGEKDYALGATHEEIVTPLVQKFALSYKDLPVAVYQIQDKFRNELRAKSGLLRGIEFNMKDLYSFHRTEDDLNGYYERVMVAYKNIFSRCGLDAKVVEASGGTFSKYSHEYQVFTESGEDDVYCCENCGIYRNKEIIETENCECGEKWDIKKAIEVGNIFKLKTKYTAAFDYKFVDEDGKEKDVLMGCYGIGPSRVLGTVVEVHNDENGIIWPDDIAPFALHLVYLGKNEEIKEKADILYNDLIKLGVEVLYDDREETAGVKLKDSDLIGIPVRVLISDKSMADNSVELRRRKSGEVEKILYSEVIDKIKK